MARLRRRWKSRNRVLGHACIIIRTTTTRSNFRCAASRRPPQSRTPGLVCREGRQMAEAHAAQAARSSPSAHPCSVNSPSRKARAADIRRRWIVGGGSVRQQNNAASSNNWIRTISAYTTRIHLDDAAERKAGAVHLANIPDGGAGFGATGLTSRGVTIRTGGAHQVGDAAVAGRMLGGGKLGALHSSSPWD
jgi:hypothetical protein